MEHPVDKQREKNGSGTTGKKVGGITGKGWVKGQSGNPAGRPKGRTLTSIFREILDAEKFNVNEALDTSKLNGKRIKGKKQVADLLAEVFIAQALKGQFPFAKEVIDRIDGKPKDESPLDVPSIADAVEGMSDAGERYDLEYGSEGGSSESDPDGATEVQEGPGEIQ